MIMLITVTRAQKGTLISPYLTRTIKTSPYKSRSVLWPDSWVFVIQVFACGGLGKPWQLSSPQRFRKFLGIPLSFP